MNDRTNTSRNTELDKPPVPAVTSSEGIPPVELSPHTSTPKVLNTSNNKSQPRIETPADKTPEQVKLNFDEEDDVGMKISDQKESIKPTSLDRKKEEKLCKNNTNDLKIETNNYNNNNNNKDILKKQIKTSDYESMSSSVVDDVLSQLTSTPETSNKPQQVGESKTKSRDVSSDLVFEDCKDVLDDQDKGNLNRIFPGQYYGQARHKDGSMLPILFEVY